MLENLKKWLSSLNGRTGVIIILTAAVLMQLMSGMQYYYAREELRSDLVRQAENELVIKAQNIRAILNNVEAATTNRRWEAEQGLNDPDFYMDLTRRFVEDNPDITGCGLAFIPDYFPSKGRLYEPYTTRRQDGRIETMQVASETHDYTTSPLYNAAIEADSTYWCNPYMDTDGAQMMLTTYIHPLHDTSGRVVAVLQIDVSVDWLGRTLNSRRLYPSSFDLLLTVDGQLISGPEAGKVKQKDLDAAVRLLNVKLQEGAVKDTTRVKVAAFSDWEDQADGYVFFGTINHPNRWQVAVVNYDDEIYASLKSMRNKTLWLMLGGLLLLAFILNRAAMSMKHLQQTNIEKERISSELHVASKIQTDMLPSVFPPFPDRKDIDLYGWLTPAKEVDGDLYDYFIRDEKLFFCIGDVSGKGVPASLVMAVVHSLFRTIAAHQTNPVNIIHNINEYCCQDNASGMFVTFFVGVLDLPTGRLRFCNAGHDLPVIVGQDGVKLLEAKANLALAVMDYAYSTQEYQMQPGDALFLYTDGLTEAMNEKHQLFTLKRVMAALEQSRAQQQTTPQALVGNMLARVADFVQGARQSDDLTLLAMRYTPQDEEVLLSRQLTLKNDLSLVKELNSFVKSVNQEMGLDKSLGMKLMLAVEEAVVNVMDYAYPNGMEGEVRIDVKVTPDRMNYTITDRGMAFAPTEVSKVDTSLSVEDRPIGGLGIFLVRNLMDSINYERIDGKNVLKMWKKMNNLNIKKNEDEN
ncbi:MAG: SpoIIE family protein phosphatase [Bacteroidaceae bacterium]|nr:SpoIIE family protein phosphatase [Bacteroidaceae bacterium]